MGSQLHFSLLLCKLHESPACFLTIRESVCMQDPSGGSFLKRPTIVSNNRYVLHEKCILHPFRCLP